MNKCTLKKFILCKYDCINTEEKFYTCKENRVVERYKMNVEIINKDSRFRADMTREEDYHNTEMRIAKENDIKVIAKNLLPMRNEKR